MTESYNSLHPGPMLPRRLDLNKKLIIYTDIFQSYFLYPTLKTILSFTFIKH